MGHTQQQALDMLPISTYLGRISGRNGTIICFQYWEAFVKLDSGSLDFGVLPIIKDRALISEPCNGKNYISNRNYRTYECTCDLTIIE